MASSVFTAPEPFISSFTLYRAHRGARLTGLGHREEAPTHFMMGFSNCLAHLHCRMQDRQYVWLQLERIPNRLSEADGFSYTTSMQILHTLS